VKGPESKRNCATRNFPFGLGVAKNGGLNEKRSEVADAYLTTAARLRDAGPHLQQYHQSITQEVGVLTQSPPLC